MFDGYNKEKTMGNSRQQVRPDKQGDMTNINNQNSMIISDSGLGKRTENKLDQSLAEQSEFDHDQSTNR